MKFNHLAILFFSLLCLANCEDEFDPISGDIVGLYSVQGYLDTEADTQWIRIMPIRESIDVIVDTIDATVTLTEIGGETVQMSPHLSYLTNTSGETEKIWNFWTTMDIQTDTEYELNILDVTGRRTSAHVTTPADFELPEVNGSNLEMDPIEDIADVRLDWIVRNNGTGETQSFSFSHFGDIVLNYSGRSNVLIGYEVYINPNDDFLVLAARMGYVDYVAAYEAHLSGVLEILYTEALVVKADEEWSDLYTLDEDEVAVQNPLVNVEDGAGYLVGAVIKAVEYNVCVGDSGEAISCNR